MNNIQIRLGHTDSVNSVDRQNFLDVELKNTSKLAHFTDIKETVDQYEQFKEERENCNKYRLIVTINPYCTNVLFNTFTEMVYAEGSVKNGSVSGECEAIIYDTDTANKTKSVYGLTKPNRIEMVMNTEYTRPGCAKDSIISDEENYVYHPGFDIFDNHILRNKSFKIVNKPSTTNDKFFNTIGDKMRYADNTGVTYKRRNEFSDDGTTSISSRNKHLYEYDNILQFENGDAVNANLTEENGWYGFINSSTIQSRDPSKEFNELNIGHVMNDHKSCEFIDMYPDRTLYSFNPKYNKYRHRLEHNWEVILTYPYSHSDDYEIVKGENCNGLLILSARKTIGPTGETIILFRVLTKHGLKRGDMVRFYVNNDTTSPYEKDFLVRNVGNLGNNEKDFYFYINDMDFIRMLDPTTYDDMEENDDEFQVPDNVYRFARVVGNVASKYYVRKFRKLPNFKYRHENFPTDGSMTIEDYIQNNAYDNGKMVLFDREQYKPAFETTIYTDDVTQVVFTDTIDIDNLVDDFGRPVTEIYFTLLKTNYGHDKWYSTDTDRFTNESIEYSHCFGNITSGLQFSQAKGDYGTNIFTIRKNNGDICIISHVNPTWYEDDITVNRNEFLGDVIEFNDNECIEHVLQPFLHRFNTAQRELNDNRTLQWHEIWSDDWDADPDDTSRVITPTSDFPFSVVEDEIATDTTPTNRPEGYYYQPHYRVPMREFGAIIQGRHLDIPIKSIIPIQADGIYLKITALRSSNVSVGDIVYLFDDENNKKYDFVVTYLENRISFYVSPRSNWADFNSESSMNWLDVANLAKPDENGKSKLCFRRKNEEIPSYAINVGKNKYLWRNVLKPGNMDIQNLPEYAYANDAFYITEEVNFYLRRQDPQGWNGLYCKDGFPNDIYGNIRPESNYIYKEEREIIC